MSQGFAKKAGFGDIEGLALGDGAGNFSGVTFEVGEFTPEFTFTSPGTLSVAYSVQLGSYVRIGKLVFARVTLVFTPTLGTASGGNRITGFPFTFDQAHYEPVAMFGTLPTFPAGTTQVLIQGLNGTTLSRILSQGSAIAANEWTTTEFTTGVARNIQFDMVYQTSD